MAANVFFRGVVLNELVELYQEQAHRRHVNFDDLLPVERELRDYQIVFSCAGLLIVQDFEAAEFLIGELTPILKDLSLPPVLYAPYIAPELAGQLVLRVAGKLLQGAQFYDRAAQTAIVLDGFDEKGTALIHYESNVRLFRRSAAGEETPIDTHDSRKLRPNDAHGSVY